MIISTIITESFPTLRKKKKKQVHTLTPKLWTALVQGGENDMNYDEPRMAAKNNSSKLSTTLFQEEEDNMAIPAPTSVAVNSINPIHIQFGI
jgi:hypothetical protein